MAFSVLTFLVLFSAVVAVLAGNAGHDLPLLPACAFCVCMKSRRAFRALLPLLFSAALLDGVWQRSIPGETLSVAIVVGITTAWWRRFGDTGSWLSLAAAGLWVGVAAWIGRSALALHDGGFSAIRFLALLRLLLWTQLLVPLYAWVLERLRPRRVDAAWIGEDDAEEE